MAEPKRDAEILDLAVERQRQKLLRDSKGNVVANEANALQIAREADYFRSLHFDQFHQATRFESDGRVRDWSDDEDTGALEYIQREFIPKLQFHACARAVRKVARERSRDELRDFIDSLPEWDGIARIDHWAVDALGCVDCDYSREVGANFMKSLVKRAIEPGSEVQSCLILEGPQGTGKSRALGAIGGRYHAEIQSPIGSADFMREISRGAWLAHLAELSQLRGGSIETVKQMLSRPEDRYVDKYEKEPRRYPRRVVFAGTTNETTYLADSTGNRRFVPLRCGVIRLDLIVANREQYFAEALARLRAGESWWELPAAVARQAEQEQQARRMNDPWEGLVEEHLRDKDSTTAGAVLSECLKKPKHEQQLRDQQRVGRVLASLGWVKTARARVDGVLVWPWHRPQSLGTTEQ